MPKLKKGDVIIWLGGFKICIIDELGNRTDVEEPNDEG